MTDSFGMSERDAFMPVVPMFHVLAWGTPYAAAMLGCKLVFPAAHLTPRDLAELIQAERVSLTAGVPTLWLGLLHLLENEHYDLSSLRGMVVGGAAAPQWMIEVREAAWPDRDARLGYDRALTTGNGEPFEELPARSTRS